jgi:tripartite ATP-independent transporter DctM subunit
MIAFVDLLPVLMFVSLMALIFTGYPIGFILAGIAVVFGGIGMLFGVFTFAEFFIFVPRTWIVAENLQIIAIPLFVFMGVMLERSNIARDLLEALQLILRRVPGGMALSVTLMGVIFAAVTGVVGASVIMLTLIALPTMLNAGYRPSLALGTIAASSTLGILIPPSILLVFLSEFLQVPIGPLFAAAIYPGLLLSALYLVYILAFTIAVPDAAPPLPASTDKVPLREIARVLIRGIIPPVILIAIILGSILGGVATITESAAFGAGGALLLAMLRGNLGFRELRDCLNRSAMTVGMIFMLYIGATSFAFVFRMLGGEEFVHLLIDAANLGPWGVLFIVIGLIFLMGFFFDVLEILLVVIPIVGPIVVGLDFGDHIPKADVVYWFAILVSITLQTSVSHATNGIVAFLYQRRGAKFGDHEPDLRRDRALRAASAAMRCSADDVAGSRDAPAPPDIRRLIA